jgi:hypothetical protein
MNVLSLALLLSWAISSTLAFSPLVPFVGSLVSCRQTSTRRYESEPPDNKFPWETPLDMEEEETLLKINLSLADDTVDPEVALAQVQKYTQSFPFAAVLPVQPLQYLPTVEGGVDILFLRKKTPEKSSIDGGMRFFVSPSSSGGVEVQVKRNSKGQTISKMFTEKMVVQAYCDGIAGKTEKRTGKAPLELVSVSSIFHKWL